jgi:thymidylate synthase (FAD)
VAIDLYLGSESMTDQKNSTDPNCAADRLFDLADVDMTSGVELPYDLYYPISGDTIRVPSHGYVQYLDHMGSDEEIVEAAGTSYGKTPKDWQKTLRYLMRHRHSTPFEMCLAGDTKIPTFSSGGATVKTYTIREIADAFERGGKTSSWVKLLRIRTVNPTTGVVTATKIKRAWKTGRKRVYEVRVTFPFDRTIVVTDNHPFLLPNGQFAEVKRLSVGDRVMLNGVPATPKDVVTEIKRRRAEGQTIKEVAAATGVSTTTVNLYAPGRAKRKTGFLKKAEGTHVDPRAIARRRKLKGVCEVPDCLVPGQVHHVDENPHNNDPTNLRLLCRKHHKHAHTLTLLEKAVPGTIASIKYVGTEDVYDLEVEDDNHTFVADGFVVHNCEIKFRVRLPIDVMRQWIRHRTANVNEYSTRYSEAIDICHTTEPEAWRLQAKNNKQGSSGLLIDEPDIVINSYARKTGYSRSSWLTTRERYLHTLARKVYEERLEEGVAREQARKDLPLSTYTLAVVKCDLHNWLHFLSLRLDSHAQLEIRQYATAVAAFVKALFPETWSAFTDYRLNAITLTAIEIEVLGDLMTKEGRPGNGGWHPELIKEYAHPVMSGREVDEMIAKFTRMKLSRD